MRRRRRKHKGERRNGGKIEKRRSVSCCIGAAACENTHSALLSPRCLMRRASREKRVHAHTQRGKKDTRDRTHTVERTRAHTEIYNQAFLIITFAVQFQSHPPLALFNVMNESPCNPLQPHTQTRTHMQLQSEILYSFTMKQREKKQATYRAQITSDYIHIDAKSQMLKKTFSEVFLCRQRGRDAVRWKPSVTDEKSLASFLSRSLSIFLLSLLLPSSPPVFLLALSCVLIIAAAPSASDSISSLCFIVLFLLLFFFVSLFLIWPLYFSPLCFTLKEEIGTLSCNPSVVTLVPAPVPSCSVLILFSPPIFL